MDFRSDTSISEPVDSSGFVEDKSMNGFSWDINEGLYIPVQSEIGYTQEPYPSAMVRRL